MTTTRPRVSLYAYSEVGYTALDTLLQCGCRITELHTHKDDPAETKWWRPVDALAAANQIPVVYDKPDLLVECDVLISAYYRRIIPTEIVESATIGAFNIHGSLLPKYRGRCPVNWAIINGETETGCTIHEMTGPPDSGPICDQERIPIGPRDTALQVMYRVADAAGRMLKRQIWNIEHGLLWNQRKQDESQATKFPARKPEDGLVEMNWSAKRIFDMVRALTWPWPGARMRDGTILWWVEPNPKGGVDLVDICES